MTNKNNFIPTCTCILKLKESKLLDLEVECELFMTTCTFIYPTCLNNCYLHFQFRFYFLSMDNPGSLQAFLI